MTMNFDMCNCYTYCYMDNIEETRSYLSDIDMYDVEEKRSDALSEVEDMVKRVMNWEPDWEPDSSDELKFSNLFTLKSSLITLLQASGVVSSIYADESSLLGRLLQNSWGIEAGAYIHIWVNKDMIMEIHYLEEKRYKALAGFCELLDEDEFRDLSYELIPGHKLLPVWEKVSTTVHGKVVPFTEIWWESEMAGYKEVRFSLSYTEV